MGRVLGVGEGRVKNIKKILTKAQFFLLLTYILIDPICDYSVEASVVKCCFHQPLPAFVVIHWIVDVSWHLNLMGELYMQRLDSHVTGKDMIYMGFRGCKSVIYLCNIKNE